MSDGTLLPGRAQKLLALDGGAGLLVGIAMLALERWLAPLYGLSSALFGFIAAANVAYGLYAATLAMRAWRGNAPSRRAASLLVRANAAWALACVGLVILIADSASMFGLAHVVLEGLFVACLAMAERRLVLPHTR